MKQCIEQAVVNANAKTLRQFGRKLSIRVNAYPRENGGHFQRLLYRCSLCYTQQIKATTRLSFYIDVPKAYNYCF
jgi:hypothetical protein